MVSEELNSVETGVHP